MKIIFFRFESLHIFDALTFVLYHSHSLFCQLFQTSSVSESYEQLFILIGWIFCMIWLIPYFECTTFLIILNSYHNCYFKVTFSVVETIVVVIEVSKAILFKPITYPWTSWDGIKWAGDRGTLRGLDYFRVREHNFHRGRVHHTSTMGNYR